jgi:hypothetical protein
VKISPVIDVIYNGRAYPDIVSLYPETGETRFLDYDGNGVYDVVFIKDYSVFFVSRSAEYSKTIYNRYKGAGFTSSLELDANGIVTIMDIFGEEIEFSDITENSVVFVTESATGDFPVYEITVSQKIEKGVLEGIEQGEATTATINGNSYKLSPAFLRAVENKEASYLEVGKSYELAIDPGGEIAGYFDSREGVKYGYLKGTKVEPIKGVTAKVFGNDGQWHLFSVKDKVNLNNDILTKEKFAAEIGVNIFIRYETNGKDEIIKAETAVLTDEAGAKANGYIENDIFRKAELNSTVGNKYYGNNRSFSNVFFLNNDALVFLIPLAPGADDEEYKCADRTYFVSENNYNLTAYDMDEYMFSSVYVMNYDSGSSDSLEALLNRDDYCMMVDKVKTAYVNGGEVSVVEGIVKGSRWSYTSSTPDTFTGLKRGDIIRTKYDDSPQIQKYIAIHRIDSGKVYTNVSNVNSALWIMGDILSVDYRNRRIRLNEGKERTITAFDNAIITIKEKDEVRVGTLNDIGAGDYVVIRMYASVPLEILVIKE